MLGKRDNRHSRPYIIRYIKGDRVLSDSARSLDDAKARISNRLAKRHNRGERAEVYRNRQLVHETPPLS